jgi:hypothetical protein
VQGYSYFLCRNQRITNLGHGGVEDAAAGLQLLPSASPRRCGARLFLSASSGGGTGQGRRPPHPLISPILDIRFILILAEAEEMKDPSDAPFPHPLNAMARTRTPTAAGGARTPRPPGAGVPYQPSFGINQARIWLIGSLRVLVQRTGSRLPVLWVPGVAGMLISTGHLYLSPQNVSHRASPSKNRSGSTCQAKSIFKNLPSPRHPLFRAAAAGEDTSLSSSPPPPPAQK